MTHVLLMTNMCVHTLAKRSRACRSRPLFWGRSRPASVAESTAIIAKVIRPIRSRRTIDMAVSVRIRWPSISNTMSPTRHHQCSCTSCKIWSKHLMQSATTGLWADAVSSHQSDYNHRGGDLSRPLCSFAWACKVISSDQFGCDALISKIARER